MANYREMTLQDLKELVEHLEYQGIGPDTKIRFLLWNGGINWRKEFGIKSSEYSPRETYIQNHGKIYLREYDDFGYYDDDDSDSDEE